METTDQAASVDGVAPSLTPRQHWIFNRRLTLGLLLVWFIVSFGVSYHARELDFRFFGWPFSFWMAAQGALLVYGLIIAFYAWVMNRLDDRLEPPTEAEEDA